ncbi:tRNA (guanosine(37)-N1)-methyltransferase TrmD [Candidatus Woesebacteria bacterium]|nr:tRNA (guanosine(37)-N1)-methyltransferase TrmD [Candidatus Woesebacteria bacterium]
MRISIITLFPDMIKGFVEDSIVKIAQQKKAVTIEIVNLRDFAIDDHGTVDDRPYGGGAGMVLRVDCLQKAIASANPKTNTKSAKHKVVLTSAKGKTYSQKKAQQLSELDHLVIVSGHYEGVDERVSKYIDEEISIGDYILTGGEIAASAIVDSIVRLLPGVLKKEEATAEESFFEVSVKELAAIIGSHYILNSLVENGVTKVRLLEYPHYTRPENFENTKVPQVLLSGNHKEVRKWRLQKAFEKTVECRPDLLY